MKKISRVRRTKEEAEIFYNKISSRYDLLTGRAEHRVNKTGLAELGIKDTDDVLEIGFGTGKILSEIINITGYSGKLCGIDISEGMRLRAESRLKPLGYPELEILCGDASRLPYENSSFDKIFMSFTLELFDTPDIPPLLSECRRVLRKSGKICVVSMSGSGINPLLKLYEFLHMLFPKQIDCRPIYAAESLSSSGFKIDKVKTEKLFTLPVDIVIAET